MPARALLLLWLAAAVSLAAPAARASEAVEALLLQAATPAELRAKLGAFVASAPETAVTARGAALFYTGSSYERAGLLDSALIYYQRAVATRGEASEVDAYVDALLLRGRDGDAKRVLEVIEPRLRLAQLDSERHYAHAKGRRAWALSALGKGDSALAQMRSVERWLLDELYPHYREWRYRLGLLELEHGEPGRSIELLAPLAAVSRFQDRDVMSILRDASRKALGEGPVADMLKRELAARDAEEREILHAQAARRITFTSHDGYAVGAVVVTRLRPTAARAVVAVMDPEETFEYYDSLAVGLARAGYAVLLLEPRGSGGSVAASCPLPDTWRGRNDEMHHLVAGDVLPGLRALAEATPTDTSFYVLIGTRASASIAVEAATRDPRGRPLVIMSPDPSPVDRGPMRARLEALKAPVFFEIPVMDHRTLPLAEELYQATDPRASRIVESEWLGAGPQVFQRDASALPRLLQWLDENWPVRRPMAKEAPKRQRP